MWPTMPQSWHHGPRAAVCVFLRRSPCSRLSLAASASEKKKSRSSWYSVPSSSISAKIVAVLGRSSLARSMSGSKLPSDRNVHAFLYVSPL